MVDHKQKGESYGPYGIYYDPTPHLISPGATSSWDRILIDGDYGHYGYPRMRSGTDIGGPFHLTGWKKTDGDMGKVAIRGGANYSNHSYVGHLYAAAGPAYTPGTFAGPESYAASAYSKMKPTKPDFNAVNAIFELRDLPRMFKLRMERSGLHKISELHLAYQFGWKPLFKDIVNLVYAQVNAQKRLAQLLRDNGKPVRRRKVLADSTTSTVTDFSDYTWQSPSFVTQFYRRPNQHRWTQVETNIVWASAQFRYWLPPGPRDIKWRRRIIRGLLGGEVTPSVVYNAIPWTWMIDWFTNVGDVISNLDAGVASRLAADYFYVMQTTKYQSNLDTIFSGYDISGNPMQVSGTGHAENVVKRRIKGDPFGWSTNQDTLNGMQLSILGALGLSRVR